MDSATKETIRVLDITGNTDIVAAWYYLLNKDRIPKVFYADEGQQDILSVLTWAKTVPRMYGAFIGTALLGLGWIESIVPYNLSTGVTYRAEMGFGFTPNSTVFQALYGGRMMVDKAFEESTVDFIFGTTPELNKEAIAYIKRLGFSMYGPIPNYCSYLGKLSGCYTSYVERKSWHEYRTKQTSTRFPKANQ